MIIVCEKIIKARPQPTIKVADVVVTAFPITNFIKTDVFWASRVYGFKNAHFAD